MAERRKDSKGRVLRNGEAQRADGMYMFRYNDATGERRTVYSWKLVETDKAPEGKHCKAALRTMEQQALDDAKDGINSKVAESVTINQLFDGFMSLRTELRESTRCNYICIYNKHVRNGFGGRKISTVRYSDVYKFYMSLSKNANLSVGTIQKINAILYQLFEIQYKDDVIRKNPVDGVMIDVSHKLKEEPAKREALTVDEQNALLAYIHKTQKFKRYEVLFTTLLGTGMRIGEALGLRWCDIDFDRNVIVVTHSLSYKTSEDGGYRYRITAPKTKSGNREIPMLTTVKEALKSVRKRGKKSAKSTFSVDGYKDFVFLNSAGKVFTPAFVFDTIQNIVTDYNRDEYTLSRKEKRDPHYLPKISAHILRHTFCTRMCENESNLKIIQDVMGHKNIRTTMDVYSHATKEAKQQSFEALDGKILPNL